VWLLNVGTKERREVAINGQAGLVDFPVLSPDNREIYYLAISAETDVWLMTPK